MGTISSRCRVAGSDGSSSIDCIRMSEVYNEVYNLVHCCTHLDGAEKKLRMNETKPLGSFRPYAEEPAFEVRDDLMMT